MVRKLNRKVAEVYSENFSSKVLDNFYANRQAANGQDILELTPVQQVNLLLIQRMYQRWQEEALRMRSPYFNYEHPQVQESLQSFMNTLSRHIQVERPALEPLLQAAVMDTLRLLFNPMAFFDEFLQHYHEPNTLLTSLRYLRMQQPLTDVLQEQVEQKETTETEYLLAILEAGVRSGKIELEPVDEHVQAFEQVLNFPLSLVDEPAEPKPAPPKEEEASDFFSAISRMAPRANKPAPKPAEEPVRAPEPEPEPAPREILKTELSPAAAQEEPLREPAREPDPVAPRAADIDISADHTATPQIKPVIPTHQVAPPTPASTLAASATDSGPSIAKQEEENRSLNKRLGDRNDKKPLYERFENKEPRSNTIAQKQRSTNIRHYITLNQRFMYVKELFGGNAATFNSALDKIDACANIQEARQWVQENMANKPQWQEDSEAAQEFQRILELRFGS